ncbi:MAG: DUF951 domain-containing protein [Caldicoprobacterales bacterium]|nr:DUF951 domain-containing protein [Clostridia bacterium]MDI9513343.1 DUF951 domain-containing protein [Bacillota bacterium]NLH59146.1 DUF951 domain-containing protein [Clostridiales bacterium]
MSVLYKLGDIVQTRKKHPCGNDLWKVIRVGADFKIKCEKCSRIVMLDRQTFLKRVKKLVETSPTNESGD